MSICKYETCGTKPYFNFKSEIKAIYCVKHKKEGMVDIKNKTCEEFNCKKQPVYNFINEKKGLYCVNHKKEGMFDIKSKTCEEKNCRTRPSFNFKGDKKALFCLKHKKKDMIDVIHKVCKEKNCEKKPNYNFKGEKKGLYCAKHKKNDMIDIKHKTCEELNCLIRPNYNFKEEQKPLYCLKHKKNGMINILDKSCKELNCEIRPSYNFKGEKIALYCLKHKKNGMINIKTKNKTCKNEWCDIRASNKKYHGCCLNCFIHLYPDEKVARNYKTKEKSVVDYIKEEFKNKDWINDKKVYDGCSKRRPDILLDLGYEIIIVEIDENQHMNYENNCENKRLMELSQDLGHRPIIFIRFNPDSYIKKDAKKELSCWGINGDGICVVKRKKEWKSRLKKLKDEIEYNLEEKNKSEKMIKVVSLFYDE